jgi:hypothetical protein
MKIFGIAILTVIFLLFIFSIPLIKRQHIFSNIFVDSYQPRKVMIIEKSPIRIIFFGESTKLDVNDTLQLIHALDLAKFEKGYALNPVLDIQVNSLLRGDRNRGASHTIITNQPKDDRYNNSRRYRFPNNLPNKSSNAMNDSEED